MHKEENMNVCLKTGVIRIFSNINFLSRIRQKGQKEDYPKCQQSGY